MSKPKSIPDRVHTLEQQMTEVRGKADAAIYLARKADEDVSDMRVELRAHKKSLEALRETQVEHGKKMGAGFKEMRERFARLEGEMRDGFSVVGIGMAQITALLNTAIARPDDAPG